MAWARLIAMVLACASEICGALLRLVHSAASPIPPTSTTNMKNRMGFRNVTAYGGRGLLDGFHLSAAPLPSGSGFGLAVDHALALSGEWEENRSCRAVWSYGPGSLRWSSGSRRCYWGRIP